MTRVTTTSEGVAGATPTSTQLEAATVAFGSGVLVSTLPFVSVTHSVGSLVASYVAVSVGGSARKRATLVPPSARPTR
jgi:hypothetical protein